MTTTPGAPTTPGAGAREQILARIRIATATADALPIERAYLPTHTPATTDLARLLAENLTDYRAHVHHTHAPDLPALITRLLTEHAGHTPPRLVIPDAIPATWIPAGIEALTDTPPLTPAQLDAADAVITTCTLAIAETGTLILEAGPGQGRRILTLIPDHHICVIPSSHHIVASLPHAIDRLDPTRPQTWIAGPSATSDIELDRVEGVHGPRRLDVILIGD
jgi:L-lactate dehydrogenase complex protein LldG